MQGDQMIETTDYFKAQLQRNYEFQDKGSKAILWLRTYKLNSLRGTIDDNLIGRDPAHVYNGVWAGKIIWKDQLMIVCIHTHVDSIGSKWRCLRILTSIVRHRESIHNASRQVLQSNKLLRIFGGSNSISKAIVKHMNKWGMSGFSINARIMLGNVVISKKIPTHTQDHGDA